MHPKSLRLLITGIALFIFGPILGWLLSILGLFQTAQTAQQQILQSTPFDVSGINASLNQTTSHMFLSLVPLLVGVLCGAVGCFLILYVLIKHFFGQAATATQPLPATTPHYPQLAPAPQPHDSSRYMPKS